MTSKERYDARTAVYISLKMNKGTDADILRRLEEVPSKQGYIKELIRADIAKDEISTKGMTKRQKALYERLKSKQDQN